MKIHRLVLPIAVLAALTLVGVLVFSRDNRLAYQSEPQQGAISGKLAAEPANATKLSPQIETLSETPAPEAAAAPDPAATPVPAADKKPDPKAAAPKAKS